ncbi:MAG: hypothetical protein ONA90_01165, partial [candidate division KSB1 bacterium]|nr:hypothetical protein [candidate division KSB1 bacterium]
WLLAFNHCLNTQVPLRHDNPFDRIYDSGDFRLVLTAEPLVDSTRFYWSEVYHSTEGRLTAEKLQIQGTAGLLRSANAPSAGQLEAIRNGVAVSGFTAVSNCAMAAAGGGYANQCQAATGSHKGYFLIRFDYRYTNKAGESTGTFYSNIVVVQ